MTRVTSQWSVPGWLVVTTLGVLLAVLAVLVALAVVLVVSRSRTRSALEAAHLDTVALREQVAEIERRMGARRPAPADVRPAREYVITRLGDDDAQTAPPSRSAPTVPGPLFADLVLREGAVQAGTLVAGLRRALSPETRHRIRFEMRREVKRARKQRRADLREARRQWEARQRAQPSTEGSAA